ncbi:MAG: hypothetical protein CBD47_03495 [Synechococcus sp. TMED187]|uniref:hypothetical protein n=1 Tax=unclassified Synechococcus TaxID=2626047 RepID=UPI000B6C1842|nr:hypothetical protein [Synechococcus sp. UW105]MAS27827.1 hypothetical protein [Synechococcus sp. NAT40]OUW48089.1 MAG: hypothetical protein CBD47_03495 [Synechococcus sp. TMED187]
MHWKDEAKAFAIAYAMPLQLAAGLMGVAIAMGSVSFIAFQFFPEQTKAIKTQLCLASGRCSPPPGRSL